MARWFDDAAKKAAHDGGGELAPAGVTRRTALKRGAVVAGVAWTAPMLMQTRAYAGVSACTSTQTFCSGPNNTSACCNSTDTCTTLNSQAYCAPQGTTGGSCGNSGQGVCSTSKCNGNTKACNDCGKPNICGGEAAYCDNITAPCAEGLVCTSVGTTGSGKHCRLACKGPLDTTTCASGQFCNSDLFCAESCTVSPVVCYSGETCQQDANYLLYCSYSQPA